MSSAVFSPLSACWLSHRSASFLSQCFFLSLFTAFQSSAFLPSHTAFGLFSPCLLSISFSPAFPLSQYFFFLIIFSLSVLPIFSILCFFSFLYIVLTSSFPLISSSLPLFSAFPYFLSLSNPGTLDFPITSLASHLLLPSPSLLPVSVKLSPALTF